jgi:hypothetical protein
MGTDLRAFCDAQCIKQTYNLITLENDMKCTELNIAGKTVESISYPDPWSEGLTIVFTDGSKLNVYERMQAGEIIASYNEEMIVHERDFE